MRYDLSIYTGPATVAGYAEFFEQAGFKTSEGTEHLYISIEADDAIDAKLKVEAQLKASLPDKHWSWVVGATTVVRNAVTSPAF